MEGSAGSIVDKSFNIYVADEVNNRIQKFPQGSSKATNGVTIAGGNGIGSHADQLSSPMGIFVDNGGNIYVVDAGNNRIQKFQAGSDSTTNGVTVAGGEVDPLYREAFLLMIRQYICCRPGCRRAHQKIHCWR